jgi:hypothetical protein
MPIPDIEHWHWTPALVRPHDLASKHSHIPKRKRFSSLPVARGGVSLLSGVGFAGVAADKEGEAADLQWMDSPISGGIGMGGVIRPQRICVNRTARRAGLEGICIGEGFKATNGLAVVCHLGLIEAIGFSEDKSPFWGPSRVYSRKNPERKYCERTKVLSKGRL